MGAFHESRLSQTPTISQLHYGNSIFIVPQIRDIIRKSIMQGSYRGHDHDSNYKICGFVAVYLTKRFSNGIVVPCNTYSPLTRYIREVTCSISTGDHSELISAPHRGKGGQRKLAEGQGHSSHRFGSLPEGESPGTAVCTTSVELARCPELRGYLDECFDATVRRIPDMATRTKCGDTIPRNSSIPCSNSTTGPTIYPRTTVFFMLVSFQHRFHCSLAVFAQYR